MKKIFIILSLLSCYAPQEVPSEVSSAQRAIVSVHPQELAVVRILLNGSLLALDKSLLVDGQKLDKDVLQSLIRRLDKTSRDLDRLSSDIALHSQAVASYLKHATTLSQLDLTKRIEDIQKVFIRVLPKFKFDLRQKESQMRYILNLIYTYPEVGLAIYNIFNKIYPIFEEQGIGCVFEIDSVSMDMIKKHATHIDESEIKACFIFSGDKNACFHEFMLSCFKCFEGKLVASYKHEEVAMRVDEVIKIINHYMTEWIAAPANILFQRIIEESMPSDLLDNYMPGYIDTSLMAALLNSVYLPLHNRKCLSSLYESYIENGFKQIMENRPTGSEYEGDWQLLASVVQEFSACIHKGDAVFKKLQNLYAS